ncbi:hypothetical protein L7H23_02815 [Sphingopyxis sp. BSN-002]|uniref:hypothetical protein n=1 Tax=Sphingopyxis sp. BSN-002 TaxID=2911495 RepID=UPI001EDBBD47|nr:hypothetical protein [Sphingopyxis sp. BSN-002]UKK85058.1 hypothetical protein L7H23_02815 [Sphingopyxis sp. BSN-002]
MALIALVGASEALPDGSLRALVTVAGETLIERQAARLADVGVTHVAVAVATVPAELIATCDRIRRRGMKVTPVREASDLVALVEPDDRIILVADGLRAGGTHYGAIAKPGSPAILVTGDTVLTQGFERIDATRRWGGLAAISQPMVAELAAMPGEWDMMLTLLRMAVQSGARRLYCEPALFEQGEIAIVADRPTAALIEQSSLQQVEYGGMGLGRSAVMMPLVRLAGPLLVRSPKTARYLPYVTAILWVSVAVLAASGLAAAGALVSILGGLCLAAMRFLSAFRAESAAQDRVRDVIRTFGWLVLGVYPWLVSLGGPDHLMPRFSEAALAPCLAAAILLARWLYEDAGDKRRFHWLLPDTDQAWILLAPALIFGLSTLMFAILPLLALLQILLWLRLARRPETR